MGNWQTLTITGKGPAVRLVDAGDQSTLIANNDVNNPIWISDDAGLFAAQQYSVELTPQSVLVVDGKTDIYGIAGAGQTVSVNLIPGGMSFFQSAILGTNFIINSKGLFFYSPGLPAHGNLAESIAPIAGTDQFGNAYSQGFTTYNPAGQNVQMTSNRIFFTNAGQFAAAVLFLTTIISGIDALAFNSPTPASTQTAAQLALVAGPAAGGSGLIQIANAALNILQAVNPANPAAGALIYTDTQNKLVQVPQAGLPMQIPGTRLATFPNITVTQTVLTTFTSGTVNGGDAEAGSTYEIECNFFGTWGSTVGTLQFQVTFGGVAGVNCIIGSTMFVASTVFRGKIRGRVICHTNGASGTWTSEIEGVLSANGNNLLVGSTNTAQNTGPFTVSESVTTFTVDSTVNQLMALQAAWGAGQVASTMTSRVAHFKRIS